MALHLVEILPEVILGGAEVWAHVTSENGDLGNSNVSFKVFNATGMKLRRTLCDDDHCDWDVLVNGRTNYNCRPKEVIEAQSQTSGWAVRGNSGVGFRWIFSRIEYTPEGSDEMLLHFEFTLTLDDKGSVKAWAGPNWYRQGYQAYNYVKRTGKNYEFQVVIKRNLFPPGDSQLVTGPSMVAHSERTVSAVERSGSLYVFHQGIPDNRLWYIKHEKSADALVWANPVDCVSGMEGRPSAVLFDNRILIFHNDSNNQGNLCFDVIRADDGRDGDKQLFEKEMSGSPSAIVFEGRLYVFYNGRDANDLIGGPLCYRTYDGSNWSEMRSVGEKVRMMGSPSAVVSDNKLFVWFQAFNGWNQNVRLGWTELAHVDGTWTETQCAPNTALTGNPSAVSYDGKTYIFHAGYGDDAKNIWCKMFYNGMWTADSQIPEVEITGYPCAAVFGDKILCFHTSANGKKEVYCKRCPPILGKFATT